MLKIAKPVSGKFAQQASQYVKLQSTSFTRKFFPIEEFYRAPIVPAASIEEMSSEDVASNATLSEYRIQTGIDDRAPVIVVASEFVPIFQGVAQIARALEMKEKAALLTARTALSALTQEKSVLDTVKANKEDLQIFLFEKEALDSIFSSFSSLYEFMKVQKFKDDVFGATFANILTRYGDLVQNYSPTKLWQQSLVELKRTLQAYTPILIAAVPPSPTSAAAYDSYELDSLDQKSTDQRIWFNFYYKDMPPIAAMSAPTTNTQVDNHISNISDAYDKLYIDLSSDPLAPNQTYVNSTVQRLSTHHRDISVLATVLTKEANYSRVIMGSSTPLKNVYGYDFSSAAPQSLFDYVVGKFTQSSLDVPTSPVGLGQSLASMSQELVSNGNEDLSILTFENAYTEIRKITPGSIYYVESSLRTSDGKSFDTKNLQRLREKSQSSVATSALVLRLAGFPVPENRMSAVAPTVNTFKPHDSLESLQGSFDVLKQIYALSARGYPPETTAAKLERLTASIFKTTVQPSIPFEGPTSSKIRSIVFMMILRQIANTGNHRLLGILSPSTPTGIDEYLLEQLKAALRAVRINRKTAFELHTVDEVIDLSAITKTSTWKSAVDVMKLMLSDSIFTSDGTTAYSKCDKSVYALTAFDLIMRVVAAMTPDVLEGSSDVKTSAALQSRQSKVSLVDPAIYAKSSFTEMSEFTESFSFLTLDSKAYDQYYGPKGGCIPHIESYMQTEYEGNLTATAAYLFSAYSQQLLNLTSTLETRLTSTASTDFLSLLFALYQTDPRLKDKSDSDRISLLNMSLTQEQIKLFYASLSEFQSRLNSSQDALVKIPGFTNATQDDVDCMPVSDMNLVSYNNLSSFFSSEEFQPLKGNNKKILSIGLPPRLFRNVKQLGAVHELDPRKMKEDLVRIRVFKVDRLNPELVFLPQEFVFEMSRFPTRVMQNWDHDSLLSKTDFDVLNAPTILVKGSNVVINRNFNEAAAWYNGYIQESRLQGSADVLSLDELKAIYKNHINSFLLEEYLRWFTDCSFDEMQYHRYDQIKDSDPDFVKEQYSNYDAMLAKVTDYNNYAATAVLPSSTKPKPVIKTDSPSAKIVDLTGTLKTYFANETFFLNPWTLRRKAAYPKKFDRVFTVIIDPDDFQIDTTAVTSKSLEMLASEGTIVSSHNSATGETSYKLRDSTPGDPEFDDYFATVEPYDFTPRTVAMGDT